LNGGEASRESGNDLLHGGEEGHDSGTVLLHEGKEALIQVMIYYMVGKMHHDSTNVINVITWRRSES
jgi:hypothetical protein